MQLEPKEKIISIYSDFMMRITQFEELVSVSSRFLVSFQQAIGFLQRAPIDKVSTLMERIISVHGSRRVLSYFEAGCVNSHDSVQHVSKLRTCHLGLQDFITKAKIVVNELESLLGVAASVVQTSNEKDCEDISCSSITLSDQEEAPSTGISRPEVADYASMMAIIYSMVKQDYTMQVRIVSSLCHKSSQGELETYCQMWSLRPFVDDEIMRKAWNLVPNS